MVSLRKKYYNGKKKNYNQKKNNAGSFWVEFQQKIIIFRVYG